MANRCALTTIDNPFNPFTQFDQWLMFDMDKGYNSCAYLARIAKDSDSLSEEEQLEETERAINEIVDLDFMGLYLKVKENTSSA